MEDARSIEGRTVCVTGASSGIGRGIAEHLGSLGAHVFMMGRTAEALEESADKITATGGRASIATFDVTDGDALRDWIQGAADETGQLNVLVNNAGVADVGASIADGDPDMWQTMFDVNVLALAVGSQAAVRVMRDTGSDGNIINISSIATFRRDSGMYGATKQAVNCINATLRLELEDDPIRVTAILPGLFATNVTRNVDRGLVEGLAASAGVANLEFSEDGRLPQAQLDQLQAAMAGTMANVQHIADAVEYVLRQPIDLNIEEMVVRPQKSLF